MSKLKDELIEIKNYLKKSKIYYKVVGSDKVHTITPLNYSFLKKKVFDELPGLNTVYSVKKNISYIHFYKTLGDDNCSIEASSDTKVDITMDDKEKYSFRVYAKDITIKNEKEDEVIFSAEIKDAYKVKYFKRNDFTVENAKETNLQGNPGTLILTVESSSLKVSDLSEYISLFTHSGDEIKFNNINCNLLEFETDAENIEVQNSNIKNSHCSFNNCVKPIFVNSTWKVNTPLRYVDGTLGNSETGITITDETFSKESIELGRAYATYGLREFFNKVESNNELDISPKLEVIDERKRSLKEEYDKKLASLEVEKDEIIDDSQNNIVKTLVKKKEN